MKERMGAGNEESQPPSPSRLSGLRWLFRRGEAAQPPVPPAEPSRPPAIENGGKLEGVITDQKLLQFFFNRLKGVDMQPIATDRFIDRSRDQYNAAWLTRELVQNFVDHNPQHPGTLDGVRFTSEPLPNDGRRFRIEGDWPFDDPTGVLSPHSDKPEDRNTAGGNGIGLKQTAIRFLRDFGVERFEIDGEGWVVNYRLAKAADINREWENIPGQVPLYKVKHDWLVGDTHKVARTGKNAYIIETNNPDVINALEQFPTLGVSSENPFLQNPDFKNKHGAIKWLPKDEATGEPVRGRLFINGQVMNYKEKGVTAENYWVGPEGVTVQVDNVKCEMSIDRPPVNPYQLSGYLDDLVNGMSKDEMIEQLKRSERLWAGDTDSGYSFDRKGAFVVVEKMARKLPYGKGYDSYDRKEYQQHFAGKNYIACDIDLSESQIRELEKQGYIICPSYFAALGMPEASSKLSAVEAASNQMPKLTSFDKEQISQDLGMEVAHEDFSEKADEGDFFRTVGERLSERIAGVDLPEGKPNTLRIMLKGEIPRDLLFRSFPKVKTDDQRFINLVRGVAAYGLDHRIFKKIFTSQGDYVTTFGLNYDYVTEENVLLVRNVQSKSDQDPFIEVELDERYFADFQNALKASPEAQQGREGSNESIEPKEVTTTAVEKVDSVGAVNANIDGSPFDKNRIVGEVEMIKHDNKPEAPIGEVPNSDRESEQQVELAQWTPEEEALYIEAVKKDPIILTEEEQRLIEKRNQLKQEFGSIPVQQPPAPKIGKDIREVHKDAVVSEAERERAERLEAQVPGIVGMVNQLDQLVPEKKEAEKPGEKNPFEQYVEWRKSDNFYGQLGDNAGYLTGKHLVELIEEQNKADIAVVSADKKEASANDAIIDALRNKLKQIVDRLVSKEDEVGEDFDIVLDPSQRQLAQLGLLRQYTHLTTGVALPNDLFIYRGTGSKGINLGQKAIGLHEALFNVKFMEAVTTFTHEVAHNYPEAQDHGNKFRHAQESLVATMMERVTHISAKLDSGKTATPEERVILDMQKDWDKLLTA